jgi:hypothetical protein
MCKDWLTGCSREGSKLSLLLESKCNSAPHRRANWRYSTRVSIAYYSPFFVARAACIPDVKSNFYSALNLEAACQSSRTEIRQIELVYSIVPASTNRTTS